MSTPENGNENDDEDEINPFTTALLPQNDTAHDDDINPPISPAGVPHLRRHRAESINADIIIRQLPSEGISFQLWPAATTLFSLLDNHRRRLNSSSSNTTTGGGPLLSSISGGSQIRILELGSGTGLIGIAAGAILGAKVTVTDLANVIPNLEFNISANSSVIASNGGAVVAAELRWGDVDQMEAIGRREEYDVILASDVVYHDHLYQPLIETLRYFLLRGEREVVFVMAHLKRWKKETAFFKAARKLFNVDLIHTDSPTDGRRVGVVVYRFVGKRRHG